MKLRKHIILIVSWIAVICWMIFIFSMSAQPAPDSKETSGGVAKLILKIFVFDFEELPEEEQAKMIEDIQHYVRKGAHFCGYTILGILLLNAFIKHIEKTVTASFLSFPVGALYAVSDELHQRFVPGRSCEFKDVILDSCGVLFGILCLSTLLYFIRDIKGRVR